MARPQNPSKPPPLLQPAFRKRLSLERRREISIVHHVYLDAIARGIASYEFFLNFVRALLTWSVVAGRLHRGESEMQVQVDLLERMVKRFQSSGYVTFEAEDYRLACEGVVVMDLLAAEVDTATVAWGSDTATRELRRRFVDSRLDGSRAQRKPSE